MTFFLFLLVNATLFLRPTDMFPALANLPVYAFLMTACCIGALRQIVAQLEWRPLIRQPITICVVGLFVAVLLSHLSHFYFYGIRESAIPFLKTALFYLVFVGIVNTPRRLRQVLLTVAVSASLMVTLCVIDYLEIVDFSFVTHLTDWGEAPSEMDVEGSRILRMRGTGLFEDPNDISLVIVSASVLCAYFFAEKSIGVVRWLWLVPIASMGVGLFCTHSRGGLLAAGAAVLSCLVFRYGRTVAIAAALIGACTLPLVAGRQGRIDLSSGTGQDRIQLWSEGLTELKSANILFGIGMGQYADLAGLVAHNSYVHAYVELGFFGGTLFFGCVFFSGLALYRMPQTLVPRTLVSRVDPGLVRFHPFAVALLAVWATGMLSLSRCYVAPTYLVFGLMAAYSNLVSCQLTSREAFTVWDRPHVTRLVAGSCALLAGLFVFVRLFVNWG